jgi:hypothetical protein
LRLRSLSAVLAASVWLAACSDDDAAGAPAATTSASTSASTSAPLGASASTTAARAAAALRAASGARRRQALAAGTVDPLDAANQLMDYAETWFASYFPSHAATGSALGYWYRHYPDTGIYLGVRDGQVYVLGGPFGAEPLAVGALASFITPQPLQLSALCSNGASHAVFATPEARVGRNLGITLAGCSGAIGNPQWQQTAGPAVTLAAHKTQTVSIDPPSPGAYAFRVNFTDPAGAIRSESVAVSVGAAESSPAALTVRASHSARMGGKVSVRAWPTLPEGDSVKAVTWTQIEGPAVTLDTRTSRLALFTAPEVARDTPVRLRATLHTSNGLSASDEVMVLIERQAQAAASDTHALWAGDHVPRVYAYKPAGAYSGVLRPCVYDPAMMRSGAGYNLCTLGTLPLLAQDTGGAIPTVEQVMDRVLVSHDWLGRNFEDFLRAQDSRGDFRRMLNSVTAIVLSTHVRPSFYYAGTGAIYLDGDSFWLTPEERDTMNEAPDYRSDFGNGLQYATLWRYVQDGKSIFAFFDPRARVTRTMTDVRNEAGWLMFHELAHALDYIPPTAYGTLQRNRNVWENIYPRWESYLLTSDTVPASHPLTSTDMLGLGEVQFHGKTATATQKGYSATQVAAFFSVDLATDDYSYSTPFEDVAMTLEEFLMQRRLGIRRDFAITEPFAANTTSATAIVRWGQRGRIGEAAIHPRARAIVEALAPWANAAEVEHLPAPIAMRPGESWSANLQQPAIPRRALPLDAEPTLLQMWQFQRELQRMRHHHRPGRHHDRAGASHRPAGAAAPQALLR